MPRPRPKPSKLIEDITKEELSRDLGKASPKFFSLVLYRGPISKSDIDYIRGVRSSFVTS